MNTKLTLRLNDDVIVRIKNYAVSHQLSLSKLTENIFRQILDSNEDASYDLTPVVKKYKGILKNTQVNEKNVHVSYLTKKHS